MYYAIYISHKKEPMAKSFVTYDIDADVEQVKEIFQESLKVNVDKIHEISKEIFTECNVSVFQGLHVLDIHYAEEKRKKRVMLFTNIFSKIIRGPNDCKRV